MDEVNKLTIQGLIRQNRMASVYKKIMSHRLFGMSILPPAYPAYGQSVRWRLSEPILSYDVKTMNRCNKKMDEMYKLTALGLITPNRMASIYKRMMSYRLVGTSIFPPAYPTHGQSVRWWPGEPILNDEVNNYELSQKK